MNVILYYLLRRFFIRLKFEDNKIRLEKGIFLCRQSVVPLSAITLIKIRRTPLLRLLYGKEVTVKTLSGEISFYLKKNEQLPFLPQNRGAPLRPKRRAILFGAFIDTRALSGIVLFSVTIYRIGKFFGSDYFDKIINTIVGTAEELSRALETLHIAVPRIATTIAVFVLTAWIFAFLVKLMHTARFRVSSHGGYLTVRRGLVTLYESVLVLNNLDAAVSCNTVITLAVRRAPVYCRGIMIFPSADREISERIVSTLCRLPVTHHAELKPPLKALFGHCAAPLSWLAVFLAAIPLTYIAEYFLPLHSITLLRTILWCSAAANAWFTFAYGLYWRHSGLSSGQGSIKITARKGSRLYTGYAPQRAVVSDAVKQNPFQRRSGLCDYSVKLYGKRQFHLRNIPRDKVIMKQP